MIIDLDRKKCCCKLISFCWKETISTEINIGQLVNHGDAKKDDIWRSGFFPSKNIRGTPKYFPFMFLDVLAKTRQFGVYTFFLTCSAAEFQWTKIVQVVAHQWTKSNWWTSKSNGLEYKGKLFEKKSSYSS